MLYRAVNRGKWVVVCGKAGVPLLMRGEPMSWDTQEEAEKMAKLMNEVAQ